MGLAPRTASLAGIADVHTDSTLELPQRLPPGAPLQLVIWLENALDLMPTLGELDLMPTLGEQSRPGPTRPPLLPGSHVENLIGLPTFLPGLPS